MHALQHLFKFCVEFFIDFIRIDYFFIKIYFYRFYVSSIHGGTLFTFIKSPNAKSQKLFFKNRIDMDGLDRQIS